MFRFSFFLVFSACACLASIVSADIIANQDSSSFAYQYEMDVNPSSQDLDGNLVMDYYDTVATGLIIPQTYIGGFAFSNQTVAEPEVLFRTDFTDSISRSTLIDADTPWTWEARVKKDINTTQGEVGWFGLAMQNPTATHAIRVDMADDRVSYRDVANGTNVEFMVGTNFADDEFHTIRVAYEGNDSYFIWVDGMLLNDDLTTASGFAGGNGSFNTNGSVFVGDFSATLEGDWSVDYLRYEDGTAAAPAMGGGVVVVAGESLTVMPGIINSGGLPDLEESDNVSLVLFRDPTSTAAVTQFVLTSTSPTAAPMTFEFVLEGRCVSRPNVVQRVEFFNYVAGIFETVDEQNAVRMPPDLSITVTPAGDPSRFVDQTTREIQARVRYRADSPRASFSSRTDQAIWMIE